MTHTTYIHGLFCEAERDLDMIIILELLVPNVAETQLVKHEGTRGQPYICLFNYRFN